MSVRLHPFLARRGSRHSIAPWDTSDFPAWQRALEELRRLPIDESLRVGIDLGEASCGMAALTLRADGSGQVDFLGVRLFDSALTPDRISKASKRRDARASRRRYRARRQRISALRRAMAAAGLNADPDHLTRTLHSTPVRRIPGLSDAAWTKIANLRPWLWRAEALRHLLPADAWSHVLLHLALHRGYEGKSKGDRLSTVQPTPATTSSDDETSPSDENPKTKKAGKTEAEKDDAGKVRAAARQTLDRIQTSGCRTFGEWMVQEAIAAAQGPDAPTLRNRHGTYARIATRDLLRQEVRTLFEAQRRFGNPAATDTLEQAVLEAFVQKPLKGVADLVGPCPFVQGAKRTARHAPSAEESVALQRLQRLQIVDQNTGRARALSPQQVLVLLSLLRAHATPKQAKAQTALGLPPYEILFVPSRNANAKAQEKTPRKAPRQAKAQASETKTADLPILGSKDAFPGTRTLEKVLGPKTFARLPPSILDQIAEVMAFSASTPDVVVGLAKIPGLPPSLRRRLPADFEAGTFDHFKEAAACSGQAMRRILPHLRAGLDLHHAERVAFPHVDRTLQKPGGLSPQAQKATREALAQITALCHHLGRRPGRIAVELVRDLGRGPEKKNEIARSLREREAERKQHREDLARITHRPSDTLSSTDLRRYELWLAQRGRCIYTGDPIAPERLLDKAAFHLDHIIPRSRGGDDEMANLVLCTAAANLEKKDQTPYAWFGHDAQRWRLFRDRVENSTLKGMAKGRLLRQTQMTAEEEDAFRNRQIHDTMGASRALLAHLHELWREDDRQALGAGERRRAIATTGRLTSILRRLWGLERLKYVEPPTKDGKAKPERVEDPRHHAVDAALIATLDSALIQRLTRTFQAMERSGQTGLPSGFDAPWKGFAADLIRHLDHGGPLDLPDPRRPGETFRPILPSVQLSRRGRGGIHKDTLWSRPPSWHHLPGVFFKRESIPETPDKAEGSGPKRRNALDALLAKIAGARKILDVQEGSDAARPWDTLEADLRRWKDEWQAISAKIRRAEAAGDQDLLQRLKAQQKALRPRRGGSDGPVIRAIRLPDRKSNPFVVRRSGDQEAYVENDTGSILRVDVHARTDKKGETRYLFVPIYRADLYAPGQNSLPPTLAPVAFEPRDKWDQVSKQTFRLSLHRGDLLLVTMKDKTLQASRFVTFHVNVAGLILEPIIPNLSKPSSALKRDARRIARARLNRLGHLEGSPSTGPEAWLWRGKAR